MNDKNKTQNKKDYTFRTVDDDKKSLKGVILEDGTLVAVFEKQGLYIGYPRKKFIPLFEQQLAQKDQKYIGFEWSKLELDALLQGFNIIISDSKKFKKEPTTLKVTIKYLINFIERYNSTGYGTAKLYETENHFVLEMYNAGFSDNEDMDMEIKSTKMINLRLIYDEHPMTIFKINKRVELNHPKSRIIDNSEWGKLRKVQEYKKTETYKHIVEVD